MTDRKVPRRPCEHPVVKVSGDTQTCDECSSVRKQQLGDCLDSPNIWYVWGPWEQPKQSLGMADLEVARKKLIREMDDKRKSEDPFAVLETHKLCEWDTYVLLEDDEGWKEIRSKREGSVVLGWPDPEEGDGVHMCTWSPDVTAEVVELLREAQRLLRPGGEWDTRCRDLLAKVKERHDHE